jgi:hypothetical protein
MFADVLLLEHMREYLCVLSYNMHLDCACMQGAGLRKYTRHERVNGDLTVVRRCLGCI